MRKLIFILAFALIGNFVFASNEIITDDLRFETNENIEITFIYDSENVKENFEIVNINDSENEIKDVKVEGCFAHAHTAYHAAMTAGYSHEDSAQFAGVVFLLCQAMNIQ